MTVWTVVSGVGQSRVTEELTYPSGWFLVVFIFTIRILSYLIHGSTSYFNDILLL